MAVKGLKNHPYIPNSVPEVQKEMLDYIGLTSLEELHQDIPDDLILKENMNIPKAFESEMEIKRHVEKLLMKNKTCAENTSFLGGGCWNHYVPAICDEINSRAEFLTAYGGEPYEDHGRFQALFEYQSLLAELLDMEVVNVPTFDWAQAASTAIRMAGRKTKKEIVLVPRLMDQEKLMVIRNFCSPQMEAIEVGFEDKTGLMDLKDLEKKLQENSGKVAAVYFENPSFMGFIEHRGKEISALTKKSGAEVIVGVDASSLGILEAPVNYGANIVCGDLQPLGIHMNYGGGQSGYIATMDIPEYVMEYPSRLFGIAPTCVEGEYGFGDVAYDRTSFSDREKGKEYVGTQTALWGITAGVYLSLMGPEGMKDLGETVIKKTNYALAVLTENSSLQRLGLKASRFNTPMFKEFVMDFNKTGKSVEEVNKALLEYNVFGGKDLSKDFPELGECSLYAFTEMTTKEEIDNLSIALIKILGGVK